METIEWAKSYLGEVDETDLQERVDRLGSMRAAVIETLKQRRATMLGSALSVSIPGAVSVSYKDNITVIDKLINELGKGDPNTTQAGDVVHPVTITQLGDRWAR
ncbi:hypothetical protein [Mobiluncus curtisii]|uniref:hypothetical protein n=1 Tax=Mobiluncus curtisii TaxID=2051 RepID=UPI00242EAC61|nr:hypothetical protein [Mobiluncus curtisii]